MFNLKTKIMNLKKLGNTLSETLISLTIIGIVFTISVGVYVADYNKNQTVVRLKKDYSVFTQALNSSMSNDGMPDTWSFIDSVGPDGSYIFFENYLKPYLSLAKDCKTDTTGDCAFTFKDLNNQEKNLNSSWVRFYLNDGTFVAVQTSGNPNYRVAYFYIDTNGKKRLNVIARDIFMFEFWLLNKEYPGYEGKFLPYGHQYSRAALTSGSNDNNCSNSGNGNFCAALIMLDDWQIKEGYPWAQARYAIQ